MRKVLTNIFRITIPALFFLFLFLEIIVFRCFLPATQWPDYKLEEEYLILKSDAEGPKSGTHTKGKWASHPSVWKVNNHGWINTIDYQFKKEKNRILIIGDSFVEGCQVNTEDIFAVQLNQLLKDTTEVYSLGASNATLASYLQMTKYGIDKYMPDLIFINIFYNDFSESLLKK